MPSLALARMSIMIPGYMKLTVRSIITYYYKTQEKKMSVMMGYLCKVGIF